MKLHTLVAFMVVTWVGTMTLNAQPSGNAASDAVRAGWNSAKRNVLASAKTMPDAKYAFKPVDTVRTYGAILAHLAGANYEFCAGAKGEKAPYAEDHFEKNAQTPAEIVKAVQDSVAYCDAVYKALTDANAGEMVSVFGDKQSRIAALMGNTNHNTEHYGNLVTYLRINGLVPPSSQPSK
jgi:uncharacterized damage-inducible protein DinB